MAFKLNPIGRLLSKSGLFAAILLASFFFSNASVLASSSFSDHYWRFANGSGTNMIDFLQGKSKIYNNGNLHIATDDRLYLDAPQIVYVQSNMQIGTNLMFVNGGTHSYTGTKIYDNGQMHIATDDNLYLDAPVQTTVSNNLNVGTDLAVTGSSSIGGDLNLTGDITVDGISTVLGNSSIGGDLTVTGNASLNNLTVDGDGTFNGSTSFAGSVAATSSVDFSGASNFKVPIISTALTDNTTDCTADGAGSLVFTTASNHFFGCDGSVWQQLD